MSALTAEQAATLDRTYPFWRFDNGRIRDGQGFIVARLTRDGALRTRPAPAKPHYGPKARTCANCPH